MDVLNTDNSQHNSNDNDNIEYNKVINNLNELWDKKINTDFNYMEPTIIKHKNGLTAKSGFKAEEIFITNDVIKIALEKYFQLNIINMETKRGYKYDTLITFNNNTTTHIQNKKIENLGGRGDSFDRRHIKNTFDNQFIRKYLTHLSLVRKNKNETFMTESQKQDFIYLCNNNLTDITQYIKKTLIGKDGEENHYWCIMKTDKNFKNIELYMLSSVKLYDFIYNSIKIDIKMKKNGTCLHLSPYISLQRKGGGNTDYSPNHIQAKFKITQEILNLCDKIL